jgi:hypothetical protein
MKTKMSNLRYLLHFVLCWALIHTQVIFTVAWAGPPSTPATSSQSSSAAAASAMAGAATAQGNATISETEAEISAAEAERRKELEDAIAKMEELEGQEDFKNFGAMFDIESEEGQNAKEDAQMKGIADAGTKLICSPIGEVSSDAYSLFVSASGAYMADVIRDAGSFKDKFKDIFENNPLDAPEAANKDRQYIDSRKACQLAQAREEAVKQRMDTKTRACDLYSGAYAAAERELGDKIARVEKAKADVKAAKEEVKSAMMAIAMDLASFLLLDSDAIAKWITVKICAASGPAAAACISPTTTAASIATMLKIAGLIKLIMDIMKLMKAMQKLKKAKRELKRAMIHSHLKCSNSMTQGMDEDWEPLAEENTSTDLGLVATGLKAARGINAYHYFVTQRTTEAKEQVAMFPIPKTRRDYTKRVFEFCFSSLEGDGEALAKVAEFAIKTCTVADTMDATMGKNQWDVGNGGKMERVTGGNIDGNQAVGEEKLVCIDGGRNLDMECTCKGTENCLHMDLSYNTSIGNSGANQLDPALAALLAGANNSAGGSSENLESGAQGQAALTIRKQIKKEQERVKELLKASGQSIADYESSGTPKISSVNLGKSKSMGRSRRSGGRKEMTTLTAPTGKKSKGLEGDDLNFDDLKMDMDDLGGGDLSAGVESAAKADKEEKEDDPSYQQIQYNNRTGPLGSTEGEQINQDGDSEIFKLITKRYIRSAFPILLKRADSY